MNPRFKDRRGARGGKNGVNFYRSCQSPAAGRLQEHKLRCLSPQHPIYRMIGIVPTQRHGLSLLILLDILGGKHIDCNAIEAEALGEVGAGIAGARDLLIL